MVFQESFVSLILKKRGVLPTLLLVLAAGFFSYHINRPFVDYDEATYAKVIVDTMASGDVSTFKLFQNNWFEKPPLYLWLAISSVKIFGVHEFAFRLPSILLGLCCLLLVYLIMRSIGESKLSSSVSLLTLLFSGPFFVFVMEARLDTGVIAGILAALLCCIKGWKDERYLIGLFPAIAIGFMFKSVIAFLAVPIILIYCFFYSEWRWLCARNLWIGLVLSSFIVVPWHVYESVRFGAQFWKDYIGTQVLRRSVTTLTGTNNWYDYIRVVWFYYRLWIFALFAGLITLFACSKKKDAMSAASVWKGVLPPLISGWQVPHSSDTFVHMI